MCWANDAGFWNRLSGETVTGPRGVSEQSQAASAQTASTDIGLAQQQAIDKVRQQMARLQGLQNRIQDLINRSGVAGSDLASDWSRVRQDWERVIRDMSRPKPQPGGTGGSRGGGSGGTSGSSDHPYDAQGRDI